jgi:phenylacetate-CoA ligase
MADEAVDFYNRELETLDRRSIRGLQNERLGRLLQALAGNRFYQEKFQFSGIEISRVLSAEDLKRLPFTTKSELIAEQRAHPPYGRLLTYPLERYRYFHQTSGTTFQPIKWLDTREDWESWVRCWGHVYRGAGVCEKDVVFCAFSFGPYSSHWAAMDGARHVGALSLSGGGLSSEQRVNQIVDSHCTVLVCTPTYALHLGEVAEAMELNLRESDIRITIHAGEPGASVPNVKRRIEEYWGARCFAPGATEVGAWAFAVSLKATPFISTNWVHFRSVDPQTGEALTGDLRLDWLPQFEPGGHLCPIPDWRSCRVHSIHVSADAG